MHMFVSKCVAMTRCDGAFVAVRGKRVTEEVAAALGEDVLDVEEV